MNEYTYRDSNLEFHKLCAIVMIVLFHGIPGGGCSGNKLKEK